MPSILELRLFHKSELIREGALFKHEGPSKIACTLFLTCHCNSVNFKSASITPSLSLCSFRCY